MPETLGLPKLWVPGQELIVPPENVTPEEFLEHFAARVWPGQEGIVTLEESLAAFRPPKETPVAHAFLDIDDLLGPLSTTLRRVMYTEEQDIASGHVRNSYHDYGEGMFFADRYVRDEDKKRETHTKESLHRLVKNAFGLRPDEDIDKMFEFVAAWRRAGVYVTVITSATEGTELAAIDFLGKYFPRNCDGIVITRGNYQMAKKGQSALDIVTFTGVTPGMPVVHIDDLSHNTANVRDTLRQHPAKLTVATFQPVFASHLDRDPESSQAKTPLGSFQQAHAFLERRLGEMPVMPTIRQLTAVGGTALFSPDTKLG